VGEGIDSRREGRERGGERALGGDPSIPNRQGLIPPNRSPDPGTIIRYYHSRYFRPHLFSPSHLAQIEILPFPSLVSPPLPPTRSFSFSFSSFLSPSPSSSYFPGWRYHTCPYSSPVLPILISPYEPYLHEAVPHVVLIIYTFSISRLFFSQQSDQTGEVFISPLIHLYARRCTRRPAFPRMLHLSYYLSPFRA